MLRSASHGDATDAIGDKTERKTPAAAKGRRTRARLAVGGGEHADREERGPGHGDEVPREVDERVKEPERGEDRERRGRRPLRSLETPQGGDGRPSGRGDEGEKEQQADGARPGEELQRDAVRLDGLDRLVAIPLAGDLEGVGARPAERLGRHDLERLAPPVEPVVRARVDEPDGLSPALSRSSRPRPRPTPATTVAASTARATADGTRRA